MSEEEVALIERHLKNDFSMLEYGSGGSTLHFSTLVKKYYSIESDKEWVDRIIKEAPSNVNMVLSVPEASEKVIKYCEREMKEKSDYSWDTLFDNSFYQIFEEYINAHKHFETKFDAVLIDGRARAHCAKAIHEVIDKDTVVFVHDFWPRLGAHRPILDGYEIIDDWPEGKQTIAALKKI
jgi:hypothetical protein